jgi:hypothetical protein
VLEEKADHGGEGAHERHQKADLDGEAHDVS